MTAKKIVSQILLVLVAAAIGGAGAWYWLAGGAGHVPSAAGKGATADAKKQQYTCSMHPFIITDKPGNCPICGMTLVPVRSDSAASAGSGEEKEGKKEKKIKYWVAPMDPNYRRDKPGKSPMGMDLVPVYEDEGGRRGRSAWTRTRSSRSACGRPR